MYKRRERRAGVPNFVRQELEGKVVWDAWRDFSRSGCVVAYADFHSVIRL